MECCSINDLMDRQSHATLLYDAIRQGAEATARDLNGHIDDEAACFTGLLLEFPNFQSPPPPGRKKASGTGSQDHVPDKNICLIAGDLNTENGLDNEAFPCVVGPYRHGTVGDNSIRMLMFAESNQMIDCVSSQLVQA